MGTSYGVGASHLCFMLATCLAKDRSRLAVVEWGRQETFRHIEQAYEGGGENGDDSFIIKKTVFYKAYGGTIGEIKNSGFQIIIVDYGPYDRTKLAGFNEMDVKLLVAQANEWKLPELAALTGEWDESYWKNWQVVVPFGDKEEIRLIRRAFGIRAESIACCKDPFLWTRPLAEDMKKLLY